MILTRAILNWTGSTFAIYRSRMYETITVLFQEPVHFHETVAENISMGDLERNADRVDIEAAASAAGAEEIVRRLPTGYDSLLGRSFVNGAELSVGESATNRAGTRFLPQGSHSAPGRAH